jgi:uncharacterized protein
VPKISLDRADTEPVSFDERFALRAELLCEDVVSVQGAALSGVIEKGEVGYVLDGVMRAAATLRCARCLEPFPFAVEETLALRLLPADAAPRDDEKQLGADELEVRFFSLPELELEEVAAEQLLLAVPMKPLCSDACLGLCPRCGANLNAGPCGCPEESDDRWQPLARWQPSN